MAGGLPFRVRFNYSYDGVMAVVRDSLQRLGPVAHRTCW